MTKYLYFIILFLTTFFTPWWMWAGFLVFGFFVFEWYWLGVASAFIFDSVYGLPGGSIFRTQFIWTVGSLLLLISISFIKQRLIYYR